MRRQNFLSLLAGCLVAFVIGLVLLSSGPSRANPEDAAQVRTGQQVYTVRCASCHGANLEGQPNWKQPLPSGQLPAPPHDETGHTWHHSDQLLFKLVAEGSAASVSSGEQGGMPAFRAMLSDEEIWAVLAYIKSTWPPETRAAQEAMNRQEP